MRTLITRPPPTYFAAPFGIGGLAIVWRLMALAHGYPMTVSKALFIVAGATWLVLAAGVVVRLSEAPRVLFHELEDTLMDAFWSLPLLAGMPLSVALASYSRGVAEAWLIVCLVGTVANEAHFITLWVVHGSRSLRLHPGYILPTVVGALLPAEVAGDLRLNALGWVCLGVGVAWWLVLIPPVLGCLIASWPPPAATMPMLAIILAPPAVGGSAYLELHGSDVNGFGYAFLVVSAVVAIAELFLLPNYLQLAFGPSFWAFTFPVTAAAGFAVRWLQATHAHGQATYAGVACAVVSVLVAGIALRTLLGAARGWQIPIHRLT